MNVTEVRREDVMAAAMSLVGTPFVHQGRSEFGIDCAGMVVVALKICGYDCPDVLGYDRYSAGDAMPRGLGAFADRIPISEARRADLLTFWRSEGSLEEHVAWYDPLDHIVQSWIKGGARRVSLDVRWRPRLMGAWRVRGMI